VIVAALLAGSGGKGGAGQIAACGTPAEQNWLCTQVYRITGSTRAAEVADALSAPLRVALVWLVAWAATRVLHRVVQRLVVRIRDQGSLSLLATRRLPVSEAARLRRAQRAATVGSVLRNIVSIVVWSIAVLMILGELGINLAPIIAGAGVAGIAIGFGTQSIVRDYLAGLFVVLEDQYGVGDEIDTGAVRGTVEWVSLRMTRIRDAEGVAWYVPNGEIKHVGNRSQRLPSAGEPDARRDDEGPAPAGASGDPGAPTGDEGGRAPDR
jgi:small-conductance mechanosensitive channel